MAILVFLLCFLWILARSARFGWWSTGVTAVFMLVSIPVFILVERDPLPTTATQVLLALWGVGNVILLEIRPFLKKRWATFRDSEPPWEITLMFRCWLQLRLLPFRLISLRFREWAHTPYDDVPSARRLHSAAMNNKAYDYFISYKSEDAGLVRLIAEQLLANNIKVWFAEFKMLTHNWDDFQREIELGIRHSKFAIAFTNNRYARSLYCHSRRSCSAIS